MSDKGHLYATTLVKAFTKNSMRDKLTQKLYATKVSEWPNY